MKLNDFKIKKEHLGTFKMRSEEHGFNTIVISGPCQGGVKDWQMVGRLVQVRKKSGAFGSDTLLTRQMNGDLMSFENQSFWSVADEFKEYYNDLFKELELDKPDREYSLSGNHLAKGFIVNGMDCTDGKIHSFTVTKDKHSITIRT